MFGEPTLSLKEVPVMPLLPAGLPKTPFKLELLDTLYDAAPETGLQERLIVPELQAPADANRPVGAERGVGVLLAILLITAQLFETFINWPKEQSGKGALVRTWVMEPV